MQTRTRKKMSWGNLQYLFLAQHLKCILKVHCQLYYNQSARIRKNLSLLLDHVLDIIDHLVVDSNQLKKRAASFLMLF
jgi:hypothetical protein